MSFLKLILNAAVVGSTGSNLLKGISSLRSHDSNATQNAASDVLGTFESITPGSYLSVDEFRAAFPLKQVILAKRRLFFRADGSDPLAELAAGFKVHTDVAVDKFLAHNYNELNFAIDKLLKSSNDIVIATLFAYPFDVANKDLMRPIAKLLDEYARFRSTPCLLEHLPTVFADPAVYRTYFTPTDGWRLTVNEEVGYMTVVPEASFVQTATRRVRSSTYHSDWVSFEKIFISAPEPFLSAVVDVRKASAVLVNQPYSFVNTVLPNWLILRDDSRGVYLVWREDSLEPVVLELDGICAFHRVRDGSAVLADWDNVVYRLSTDLRVPLVAERLDYEHFVAEMQPSLLDEQPYVDNTDSSSGFCTILTAKGRRLSDGFTQFVADSVSGALDMPFERVQEIMQQFPLSRGYPFLKEFTSRTDGNNWLWAEHLCKTFGLRSREDFVAFIVDDVRRFLV